MSNYLAAGAIGLGLALAVLAFRLLSKEQDRPGNVRRSVVRAIYAFMGFALVLSTAGFVSEYLHYKKIRMLEEELLRTRTRIEALLDQKEGELGQLGRLDGLDPEARDLVEKAIEDLKNLDVGLRKALGEGRDI